MNIILACLFWLSGPAVHAETAGAEKELGAAFAAAAQSAHPLRVSHQDPEAFWRRLREENRHRAESVSYGLVVIKAAFEDRGLFGARKKEYIASGFFVDASGLVLTNHHAVSGPGKSALTITTILGDEFTAEVVASDAARDLALLKVEGSGGGWPALALGDSNTLRQGDPLWVFGAPLGLEQTMTQGTISALDRQAGVIFGEGSSGLLIQTDAAVNHGNSGGPVVDGEGSVVGVAVGMLSNSDGSQGLNLVIPINDAVNFVNQFRASGVNAGSREGH